MSFSRRYGLKAAGVSGSLIASAPLARLSAAQPLPIGTPDAEPQPIDGGEWIVGISELPDTLDPHTTGAAITSTILNYAGDRLIAKNFEGEYAWKRGNRVGNLTGWSDVDVPASGRHYISRRHATQRPGRQSQLRPYLGPGDEFHYRGRSARSNGVDCGAE